MPYCKILMTLTVAILSQSFLRTSKSATRSQKTAAFIINIAYCLSFFGHMLLHILSCLCETVAEGPAKWHDVGTLSALSVVF